MSGKRKDVIIKLRKDDVDDLGIGIPDENIEIGEPYFVPKGTVIRIENKIKDDIKEKDVYIIVEDTSQLSEQLNDEQDELDI